MMAYYTHEEVMGFGFSHLGCNVKISTKASIYDSNTGENITSLEGSVYVKFSPNGKIVAIGDTNNYNTTKS